MWIFDTASFGSKDEPPYSDIWYEASLEMMLSRADFIVSDGTTVYDALEQSFDDLMELCGVVTTKFTIARDEFNERLRT